MTPVSRDLLREADLPYSGWPGPASPSAGRNVVASEATVFIVEAQSQQTEGEEEAGYKLS